MFQSTAPYTACVFRCTGFSSLIMRPPSAVADRPFLNEGTTLTHRRYRVGPPLSNSLIASPPHPVTLSPCHLGHAPNNRKNFILSTGRFVKTNPPADIGSSTHSPRVRFVIDCNT